MGATAHQSCVAALAQLIVIHIIRAHLEAGGVAVSGWLRGLADRRLAPVLDLMHLADRALRSGGQTVAEIGHMLGYASESAFGAAFKREMGVSPRASLKLSRAG
ncbi:helix-turn-helix domain-containing protein [Sphingomonas sanxanigenens]|uniref:HTH araC/xylS-type domain-containing protein n=1 Tax=Sphingomonas sanxanigenens DSM 19645 = NX02 TaxID=1123269 RepID=W0AMA1_9SPHN|nr:helix-turn-helix domain-containing protein [Sphingomonas sanxanigenens]AHE56835.1 hypothetical protein NX02_26190 [Sphingomonas sanxanigenens DSM 19645 = NX02]